ncbi:MAG: FKBP-type peptidyl-prolyl cis-trans isomerase [Bacteriovoracaceae bacterium]
MKIVKETVVTISYNLRDGEGNLRDTTEGKDPLCYIHGAGHLIPGVEKQLDDKQAGDNVKFTVKPDEAYGFRNEELIHDIPFDQFEEPHDLKVGMEFEAQTEYGPIIVQIISIDEKFVTVDGNHPLAGEELEFDIKVIDVRPATASELASGEVDLPTGMTQ